MTKKAKVTGSYLKAAVTESFQRAMAIHAQQIEYVKEITEKLPVAHTNLIKLAEVVAGVDKVSANARQIIIDLTATVEALNFLAKQAEENVTEANAALFALKEYEDTPQRVLDALTVIAEDAASMAMFVEHLEQFIQTDPGLVTQVLTRTPDKIRVKALDDLSADVRARWLRDLEA